MKLVVTAFVTLDGVAEGPGVDEHNRAQVTDAAALLLGPRTWQIWAAFWPTAGGDAEMVEKVAAVAELTREGAETVTRRPAAQRQERVGRGSNTTTAVSVGRRAA